jgi:glycosyltransferase involved in cell wall biosynthesis
MGIYYKVPAEYLKISIESVLNQTVQPKKIIIVKDGKLTNSQETVLKDLIFQKEQLFELISFSENKGSGPAYNEALKHCLTKYAMIMDSDDYIAPDKAENELLFLNYNKKYDIVGTNVYEFIETIENIKVLRKMPETHEEIVKFAHSRCPIVQPSAMFKVERVLAAGGYQESKLTEDYDLYIRMIMNNCKFYNIQKFCTFVRVSEDFYGRRGGIRYLKPIIGFKYKWYKKNFYTLREFLKTSAASLIVSLLPNKIRTSIYNYFLRGRLDE